MVELIHRRVVLTSKSISIFIRLSVVLISPSVKMSRMRPCYSLTPLRYVITTSQQVMRSYRADMKSDNGQLRVGCGCHDLPSLNQVQLTNSLRKKALGRSHGVFRVLSSFPIISRIFQSFRVLRSPLDFNLAGYLISRHLMTQHYREACSSMPLFELWLRLSPQSANGNILFSYKGISLTVDEYSFPPNIA